jgi:tetratricopeptide (TPR) repeat protein
MDSRSNGPLGDGAVTTAGKDAADPSTTAGVDDTAGRVDREPDVTARANVAAELYRKGYELGELRSFDEAAKAYDALIERFGDASEPELRENVAMALLAKSWALSQNGATDEAIEAAREVVKREETATDPRLQAQLARALVAEGYLLDATQRHDEALAAYERAVDVAGHSDVAALREQTATALGGKAWVLTELGRSDAAVEAFNVLIERFGTASEVAIRTEVAKATYNKGIVQTRLGLTKAALETYDEVLRNFGDAPEVELRENAAMALLAKCWLLYQGGAMGEAIDVAREVVRRDEAGRDPRLQAQVARALVTEGYLLDATQRREEALKAYAKAVAFTRDSDGAALREQAAAALGGMAWVLGELARWEDTIATCDELIGRFGTSSEPAVRELVAKAAYNKGVAQTRLGRTKDAIASYDEVVRTFGDASETVVRQQVAAALGNKASLLAQQGDWRDGILASDEVVDRFGSEAEPAQQAQVAAALVNKSWMLGQSALEEPSQSEQQEGLLNAAVAACDEVDARFGTMSAPELRAFVAQALVNKCWALNSLGKTGEAVRVCDEVVDRFESAAELPLQEQVAKALYNKGVALGKQEAALAPYDDVVARFGNRPEPVLRIQVAAALVNKGLTLGELGRFEEAIEVFDDVVARYGDDPDATLTSSVATSIYDKGVALAKIPRLEQALATYRAVVDGYGTAKDPFLLRQVAAALRNEVWTLLELGRFDEAIAACDDAADRFAAASDTFLVEQVAGGRVELRRRASRLRGQRRYTEAEKLLLAAGRLSPGDAAVLTDLGHVQYDLRRYDGAVETFEKVLKIDPNDSNALRWRGRIHYAQRDYDAAVGAFETAYALLDASDQPNQARLHFYWGLALAQQARFTEALEHYHEVIRLDESHWQAHHNIASTYWSQGRYSAGMMKWQEALKIYVRYEQARRQARDSEYFFWFASVLQEIFCDYPRARETFMLAREAEPTSPYAFAGLATLSLEGPEEPGTWEAYKRAQSLIEADAYWKNDPSLLCRLAELQIGMRELDDAKKNLDRAKRLDAGLPRLSGGYGLLYCAQKDFERAAASFEAAKRQAPWDLTVRTNLANAYLRSNSLAAAESEFKDILSISREHIEAWIGLGEVYTEMADAGEPDFYEDAVTNFCTAIKLASLKTGKNIPRKKLADAYYSCGYARVKSTEKSATPADEVLRDALNDFLRCRECDPDNEMAKRTVSKLNKRLNRFSPQGLIEKVAPILIVALALYVFIVAQWGFFLGPASPHGAVGGRIGEASYVALTFGTLIIMIAGLSLPQVLKLSFGGVSLEKSSGEVAAAPEAIKITRIGLDQIAAAASGEVSRYAEKTDWTDLGNLAPAPSVLSPKTAELADTVVTPASAERNR